ncbi:copper transporter [Colletotrichum plurivorum]|uniref:Copper transport protein n=1 Tax=Colletotrichum plurivorum TaxID=2175906 RepID=A0A8H6J8J4_9PEZI|nr:copper transporter [Colletotrichum plurivorum]
MEMSGHQHSHSTDAGPMVMPVTFHTTMSTSLFSEAWTPRTSGQYAGTCIALVVFTIILRALIAFKPRLEATVWNGRERGPEGSRLLDRGDSEAQKEGQPVESDTVDQPSQEKTPHQRKGMGHWLREGGSSVSKALYDVVIAFLGYLLMLAVMSLNVGYFLSVLLGVFLGTLGLGGIARDTAFDHCA